MSIADDLINDKLSTVALDGDLAESVQAIAELLGQQVGELTKAFKDRKFTELSSNAAVIRDVAAMLDGVADVSR